MDAKGEKGGERRKKIDLDPPPGEQGSCESETRKWLRFNKRKEEENWSKRCNNAKWKKGIVSRFIRKGGEDPIMCSKGSVIRERAREKVGAVSMKLGEKNRETSRW